MYARKSALLVACALAMSGLASAQERFGNITGKVLDQTGAVLPGVTVTVTNNETQRSTVVVTDSTGAFYATALEPGRYNVKFELSGFIPQEAPNVILLLGTTATVDSSLRVGGVTETVQVLAGTPLIDVASTTQHRNIPAEEFDVMPKGRSFQTLATALPSVSFGELEGGIQVNGASAGENNFTVDGVSVVSQIHGAQRQDAVFEYMQEVQVKTSGLEAEYGGALGGVISAVTKSGGNTFRGSLFEHYSASWLRPSNGADRRLQIDPLTQNSATIVQDDDQSFDRNEFGGTIGGPIVRDHLFFFGSISPRFETLTRNYHVSTGEVVPVTRDRNVGSYFGKMTYSPISRLQLNLSGLWTPAKDDGSIVAYDGTGANQTTQNAEFFAARQELGWEIPQWNLAYTGDYTATDRTLISVRGGYMRDDYFDTGVNKSQTFEYVTPTSALSPSLLATVPQQYRQPAGYQNLPRIQINDHDLTSRNFADFSLTQMVNGAGQHQFKTGFGISHANNDVQLAYPNGGYVSVFWNSVFTSDVPGVGSGTGTYGYYTIDDIGTIGATGANILSFFVQDNWSVTPRLTLNLGVRMESEDIPSFRQDIATTAVHFGWGQKVAPRLGFAYNLFGDDRVKISGSYGRYYDWTKYELARGTFGGDVWTTRYRSLDDPDISKLSRANLTGRNLWDSQADSYKDHRVPSFGSDVVDPDMKPMSQDSYNLGLEYQAASNTVVGVNFVRTNLLRTIEDIGTLINGSETYIYGNPGEGLATTAFTTGLTAPFEMPKAKRQYTAVEFTANRRFSNNWFLGGSYVISKLYGNYNGLVNTDEVTYPGRVSVVSQQSAGQRTRPGTNASRAWDLDQMMFDSHGDFVYGRLPTDRPHVVKVYGSYLFGFGTNVGLNFYGGSGQPISQIVQTTSNVPVFVEGRGNLGRTDALSQTDLLVSHEFRMGSAKRLRLEFNGLNIFNQRQVRHVFDTVNRIGANGRRLVSSAIDLTHTDLQSGYNYNALLAASPDASKPAGTAGAGYQDPRYQQPDIWNPGFDGRFTVRFLF
jgi:Carboxypeptidase regulatory-like domain/TonB dependent receptor